MEKIVNADDFGISPGVNAAIMEAFEKGCLNSASLMMNVAHTKEAICLIKEKGAMLNIGIHLNLTCQKNQKPLAAVEQIPLLVDQKGNLKHGFVGLLLCSLLHPKAFKEQATCEMKAQIEAALKAGIYPSHLDSHRHVHMIPALFQVTLKLGQEYQIKRVRVVNESFWQTFKAIRNPVCFWDGGFIKCALLKFFSMINRYPTNTYFYSILYTTKLYGRNVAKIKVPTKFEQVEIGIHPSQINIDAQNWSVAYKDYLLDLPDRQREFETLLDKDFLNRIS